MRGTIARLIVADGGRLVDVRSLSEYNAAHITGARNIPYTELPTRMDELNPRSEWVVVYCASGGRSTIAANTLADGGFAKVFNLGAMSNW